MKTLEMVTLKLLQGVSVVVSATVIIAVGYAILQVILGNVHSTASFEF